MMSLHESDRRHKLVCERNRCIDAILLRARELVDKYQGGDPDEDAGRIRGLLLAAEIVTELGDDPSKPWMCEFSNLVARDCGGSKDETS
jgi:hypothetical protein